MLSTVVGFRDFFLSFLFFPRKQRTEHWTNISLISQKATLLDHNFSEHCLLGKHFHTPSEGMVTEQEGLQRNVLLQCESCLCPLGRTGEEVAKQLLPLTEALSKSFPNSLVQLEHMDSSRLLGDRAPLQLVLSSTRGSSLRIKWPLIASAWAKGRHQSPGQTLTHEENDVLANLF